jgi:hypothetical protein
MVRDWTNRDRTKHWASLSGLAKGLTLGPSINRTKVLTLLAGYDGWLDYQQDTVT